jgi:hypothetical protein
LKIAADAAIWQTHNELKRFETSLSINAMIAEPWVTDIDVVRHLVVVKDTVYRWQEHKGSTRAQDRATVEISAIRDC